MIGYIRRGRKPLLLITALVGLVAIVLTMTWPSMAARYHLRAAKRASQRGDLMETKKHLDRCLAYWPENGEAHLLAAQTARRSRAFDEAEHHLNACERSGEMTDRVKLEGALLRAERGELEAVEPFLHTRLARSDPDSLEILDVYTKQLMDAKPPHLAEARHYLSIWLEREPNNEDALLRSGRIAERFFDVPAATAFYQKVVALNPGRAQAHLRLVEILLDSQDSAHAMEHIESLREQRPNDSVVLLLYARCLNELGRFDEAGSVLDQLLAKNPHSAHILGERGKVSMTLGEIAKAEKWLREAAKLAPHDVRIIHSFYLCLQKLGKTTEAKPYVAKLASMEADQGQMRDRMAEVGRRPHDAGLHLEIGQIFLRNGFDDEGLGWFDSALRQNPGHRPTLKALAEYWQGHGKSDLAARYRRVIEKLDKEESLRAVENQS